jgi:hypothetical protein
MNCNSPSVANGSFRAALAKPSNGTAVTIPIAMIKTISRVLPPAQIGSCWEPAQARQVNANGTPTNVSTASPSSDPSVLRRRANA